MAVISVALASYNGADFIIEQLESLRSQTLPATQVVICDDCSTDDTVNLIRDYISDKKLIGWSVEVNETNLGFASNFAKALSKCSGDYVFFSDQDDIFMPDKFEKMVRVMEENTGISLLCSEYKLFQTGDETPEYAKNYARNNLNNGSLEKVNLSAYTMFIRSLGCVMCVRKKFADSIQKYWFNGWAHDEYVWKMAQMADGCYIYHEELIKHRVHAHNVSMHKNHNRIRRIEHLELLLRGNEACRRYVEDTTNNAKYLNLIDKNITSEKLRIDLLKKKHLFNTIPLLFYSKYYHSRKSLLMEPWIALHK